MKPRGLRSARIADPGISGVVLYALRTLYYFSEGVGIISCSFENLVVSRQTKSEQERKKKEGNINTTHQNNICRHVHRVIAEDLGCQPDAFHHRPVV